MFIRYLIALCLIAIFAVTINADEEVEGAVNNENTPTDKSIINTVSSYLVTVFANARATCFWDAVAACKEHWDKPQELVTCGTNFRDKVSDCMVQPAKQSRPEETESSDS